MITYNTHAEYTDALNKLTQYESAAKEYMTANKTNGIPVDICNTFPYANEVNNDMRTAIEVYQFMNTPPDKYFLYIDEQKSIATTWTGQRLGNVTFGREYTSNMGDKRHSVSIWAINGASYYGTYYKSSGDYARIFKRKKPTKNPIK